jgi:hypothetical protein
MGGDIDVGRDDGATMQQRQRAYTGGNQSIQLHGSFP